METPLLQTKLSIPQVRPHPSLGLKTNLILRPRLIERLEEGVAGKLTVISAPAGFGKTTQLSVWARQAEMSVAWVSLENGDNDLTRFLAYAIAALQTSCAEIDAAALAMLESPQPPPLESLLTVLINDLMAIPYDFALVLDDYHTISAQPIHQALTFLLDHLPPQMHLLIATRADPPLLLARLRAQGQLTELRHDDLRFSTQEVASFLNEVMGLQLSSENVAALTARTEGWIAGLQLAALSMQNRRNLPEFIEAFTGSHHYILDYLMEEVFQQQSEPIQTFLLQTSILDRLSSSLCDAVTCRDKGRATLEMLAQANLFIVALDNERRWFRYHRLFADLLRHRLHRAQPNDVPELHLRAAQWYEQHGFTTEAIDHAMQAEAHSEAARLVEAYAFASLKRGGLMTVLGWIERLPDHIVHTRPWLSVWRAWALLLTGQVDQVEQSLQRSEQALGREPFPASGAEQAASVTAESQQISGHLAAIRAYVAALSNEPARAMTLAQQALALLPAESHDVRSIVTFVLGGVALLNGDVAASERAFAQAGQSSRAAGNIHLAVPAGCALADLQVAKGGLHQASATYQDVLQLATGPSGRPLPVAAQAHVGIGALLYEWNDLAAAGHHLETGLELSQQWGQVDTVVGSHLMLARLRQAQGDLEEARELLEGAGQMMRKHISTPTMEARFAAHRICLWLAENNLAAAARYAAARGLNVSDEPAYIREVEEVALVRLLLAQGALAEAKVLLARLRRAAEASGRMGRVIERLILQALTLQTQGDTPQAMIALERALSLAEPQGYIRVFLDEGEPLLALLRHAVWQGIAPAYASKLISAAEEPSAAIASSTAQPLLEPLSEREIEVLRLIAAGRSNQEIAQDLVIAVGTVKAHTSSIYRKLDVRGRTQAVAQARELKLL